MRKEELKVISDAQKASIFCETTLTNGRFHLNTDGTTKQLKKLEAVAIDDIVVPANQFPDGTVNSIIADISRELKRLRDIAHILQLPNPDCINWTMIVSSTSDSAATQKRLNKLIEECRETDENQFSPFTSASFDLVENLCSMHLGINLCKAFINGRTTLTNHSVGDRQYHLVDTLIHEFCKLFGQHGAPEYGFGTSFADILALMVQDGNTAELHSYYQSCTAISLKRQLDS